MSRNGPSKWDPGLPGVVHTYLGSQGSLWETGALMLFKRSVVELTSWKMYRCTVCVSGERAIVSSTDPYKRDTTPSMGLSCAVGCFAHLNR